MKSPRQTRSRLSPVQFGRISWPAPGAGRRRPQRSNWISLRILLKGTRPSKDRGRGRHLRTWDAAPARCAHWYRLPQKDQTNVSSHSDGSGVPGAWQPLYMGSASAPGKMLRRCKVNRRAGAGVPCCWSYGRAYARAGPIGLRSGLCLGDWASLCRISRKRYDDSVCLYHVFLTGGLRRATRST
jgi:hypothetical protein